MHEYKARLAAQEEIPNIVEWTHANRGKNFYDPEIFQYDSTRIMAVDQDGSPIGYLPFQATIMTESLAPKPARTLREIAMMLKMAILQIAGWAKSAGMGEIYFLSHPDDVETREFAKAHGYEELNLRVMRLKLKNVNPQPAVAAKE
jgi:hypothetical protein